MEQKKKQAMIIVSKVSFYFGVCIFEITSSESFCDRNYSKSVFMIIVCSFSGDNEDNEESGVEQCDSEVSFFFLNYSIKMNL